MTLFESVAQLSCDTFTQCHHYPVQYSVFCQQKTVDAFHEIVGMETKTK